MLINGWHSDKTSERRWHTAIPLVAAGLMFGLLIFSRHEVPLAISFLLVGSGLLYAYYPTFWAIPTMLLSESAAAATFGLINSIGQLGGFVGNYAIGFLNDHTHSLTSSFGFIALVEGPLFDALGFYESRLQEDFHMLAGGGLAYAELLGNEHAANAVFHQVAIDLRAKVLPRVLQPIEDLQATVIRQGPERKPHLHIDN